ncbi:MAG: hypothetical protein OEZ22_04785 [Spirochaetia bacterium]|nr:hypothetical protein [Spirochaetia bacterium]
MSHQKFLLNILFIFIVSCGSTQIKKEENINETKTVQNLTVKESVELDKEDETKVAKDETDEINIQIKEAESNKNIEKTSNINEKEKVIIDEEKKENIVENKINIENKNLIKNTSKIAVIYDSISSGTDNFVFEISKKLNANIIKLNTKLNTVNYIGWIYEFNGIENMNQIELKSLEFSIKNYDFIIMVSPVWFYRPKIPLWPVIQTKDIYNKKIVVINIYEGRFNNREVNKFFQTIKNNGAILKDKEMINRKDFFNIEKIKKIEINNFINKKTNTWLEYLKSNN